MMPSLFVTHGAPLLAVEDNDYTRFLSQLGRTLPKPRAAIVFSAHWESARQEISEVEVYETIHDYWGFPEELYRIHYPARGDVSLAHTVENLLTQHGVPWEPEPRRGLDHGAWVVLRLLYPDADVPVIAVSVNPHLEPLQQYAIGEALAELREENVLVIGSGATVHNLRTVRMADPLQADDWAVQFDDWVSEKVTSWNLEALSQYADLAPGARLAVPPHGNEHFIPLFYAMGAAGDAQRAECLHRSYRYGSLSHMVWKFG